MSDEEACSRDRLGLAGTLWRGMKNAQEERERGGARTLVWVHDAPDGRRVFVYQMTFNNCRLCIGPPDVGAYDEGYCYEGEARAAFAAATWIVDGAQGEPDGWKKNLQTGEYREQESAS